MDTIEVLCVLGAVGFMFLIFGLMGYYISNRPKR